MDAQDRPTVIRLLVYMTLAAGMAGGLSGWVGSSGALEWISELNLPSWMPQYSVGIAIWAVIMQMTAVGLWIAQRTGRDGLRFITAFLLLGLVALICARTCVVYGARDVTLGFLATLGTWIYALFAIGLAGRCSRPAGLLLWPLFFWLTYALALSFEIMRLNSGGSPYVGGL
jgi:benzodiazapine receptor